MALTAIQTNNKLIKFRKEIYREFVRQNMFGDYMGTGLNAIIRVLNDLKSGGEQINVPLVNRLAANAVANGILVGNEEAIDNYGCRLYVDWARNAVVTNKQEMQRDSADIFDIARPLLSDWGKELIKNEVVDSFNTVTSESAPAALGSAAGGRVNGISMDSATAAQRNTWVTDNVDRVLFGLTVSNYSTTFATATATLDTTNDKLTAASLRLMKRLAMKTNPRIRPYQTNDGYDFYIVFTGPNSFRDLSNDTTIINANLYAKPRENGWKNNILFRDGDILYDGMIVRQVPEIDLRNPVLYTTAGASGTTRIAPTFLCGQGALAQVWGEMPRPTTLDQTDYQFRRGVGLEMCYGLGKIFKKTGTALKDWGVFTGFFASVNDA